MQRRDRSLDTYLALSLRREQAGAVPDRRLAVRLRVPEGRVWRVFQSE